MKKMVVGTLSLSMVFGLSSVAFAGSHAKDGSNIIPGNAKWSSFSICTREDGGSWEDSLKEVYRTNSDGSYFLDENGQKVKFVKGVDYATEGWINGTTGLKNNSSEVTFFCKATGWDGEYATLTRDGPSVLVSDNPCGMTLTMTGIPVELGRYYTMEFDMGGTLKEAQYDAINNKTEYVPKDKHILLKAYDYNSNGEPSAAFENVTQTEIDEKTGKVVTKEVSKDGFINVYKQETEEKPVFDEVTGDPVIDEETGEQKVETVYKDPFYTHVVAKFKIPESPDDWGGGKHKGIYSHVGIKFAMGANLVSYPLEGSMRGNVHIKNMKMTAGKQYLVKYFDGKTQKASKFVNDEESATSVNLSKAGYTLAGYTNMATGKKYNFSTILNSNLNLRAIWTKTPAPKKASFKIKSKKKKRETVTFGGNSNIQGYQVKYSYNSKFKKKSKFKTKTKNTSNTETYTIKSLKSGAVVYVKVRGFNKDSAGNKVFGPWSKRKVAYVR